MATLKLFLFAVLFFPIFAGIGVDSDASIPDGGDGRKADDSSILEQLNSRIRSLEQQVEQKTQEIKDKDATNTGKEKIIQEKLERIVSLEKQVQEFKKDVLMKIKEKEQLKSQVHNLQKVVDKQNTKIRDVEQALKLAEGEIMTAKLEVEFKTKELIELYGAWLPPWLAAHFAHYKSHLGKHWEVHGKPMMQLVIQKAMEKNARVKEWITPHIEKMKMKWAPVIQQKWIVVEPRIRKITAKTVEICQTSKNAIAPHIIKAMEMVTPYFQEVRKVGEPYIYRVVTATRPHVASLHTTLKPYTQPAIHTCGKFFESATFYHNQVQERVQEKLEGHELTKPFATKELVWFTASALLALPMLLLMRFCSAISRYP